MPNAPNIRRNIAESAENIYVNRFWSGEVTQRSALFTPISALGLQIISRHDTLFGGADMELSPNMTLVRRYGHSRYCSAAFGASDWPLAYFSFKNIAGTIALLVDTPTMVAKFTSSAISSLYTKGTTAQSSFAKVGNYVYICDGTNLKKWDQTTVTGWGITAPATAPGISASAGSVTWTSGTTYVFVYKNSTSGHISTASPASGNLGPLTGKEITVTGARSTDAQVDKIDIYRTEDGGSVYYFVAEIANPGAGSFSYVDNNADSVLNLALIAPLAGINAPPPTGLDLVTWHNDRLFGAANNLLYFSSGPDCTNGVQAEAWNPSNVFTLPSKITALASTSQGLLVFTQDDIYVCLGTDTVSYYVIPWQRNYGVLSQNCVAQDGDSVYFYTSKSQLWEITSNGMAEVGFPIGDQLLSTYAPASSYLAIHRSGTDVGLWISDGSAHLKKWDPRFSSDYGWNPTATPSGGVGAIRSIETSVGTWQLMVGLPTASGHILKRDTTLYTDDGTSYTCNGIVGSLMVAPPGGKSRLQMVLVQAMPVGTAPSVGVLLNNISGSFTSLSATADPPELNVSPASLATPTTITQNRYYFKSAASPLPEFVQNLQIKLSFPAENFRAEILGLGIQ